jgi:hypothetical protein
MYVTEFEIRDIKCFKNVTAQFPLKAGTDCSGWHVFLGANGTGKSALLQALAIALVGPQTGQRLLYDPTGWTRKGQKPGEITAKIFPGKHDKAGGRPRKKPYTAKFAITGSKTATIDGQSYSEPQLVQLDSDRKGLSKGPYAPDRSGWLACGYGPFRRLTGMGSGSDFDLVRKRDTSRFATLFREGTAITDCTDWLTSLYSSSIDPHLADSAQRKGDLRLIKNVINHLLPAAVQVVGINSQGVCFRTIGGVEVTALDLSDGYRSFLALAVDLLRHIHESVRDLSTVIEGDPDNLSVTMDGVVLIDEVDAHLHPRWQREIGFQLCRIFPHIQFIVTAHSPFVAQAAEDRGLFVLQQSEDSGPITILQPVESIRGWRAEQILTSRRLFGLEGTRDRETERLIREHGELVQQREWGNMSTYDRQRLSQVEQRLSELLTGPGESMDQIETDIERKRYIEHALMRRETE